MTTEKLAKVARDRKNAFLQARANGASYDELKQLAQEYAQAAEKWHQARWPGRRYKKPSVGYLIRSL